MTENDKPLVWLHGEIRTPPMSLKARLEAGWLLRRLQKRESLGMPHSRPMPSIGPRVHELRIRDVGANWRIIYRIDQDAIVLAAVFCKTTQSTPRLQIESSRARLQRYDQT